LAEKILITGANGQLGTALTAELTRRKIPHKGIDRAIADITDRRAVMGVLHEYSPTAVMHCAAYTAVDRAEDEPELCRLVNVDGTRNIAMACKEINAKLVYISTDYVFAGDGDYFHKPTDPTNPQSVYGASKLAGEMAVQEILQKFFIVRTSWVYGENGGNFVKTMLKLGGERDSVKVVNDQIGSPTYTADLAKLLCDMAITEKYGIYHATNEGVCSWAKFAEEIFTLAGLAAKVEHIPTAEYPTKAIRPLNSRLDKAKLYASGFEKFPHWTDALHRYLEENSTL